ncbi:MAG: hypothetical protein JSV77_04035 [Dehalococcoidales bacterium]|nr:MAG: hypothetical protein JSV77_04035 [Dehalococcoidales bacterium]
MEARESLLGEFSALHATYSKANERMLILQATAIEGLRKIGAGCLTEEARAEFISLEKEIGVALSRMRAICEALH